MLLPYTERFLTTTLNDLFSVKPPAVTIVLDTVYMFPTVPADSTTVAFVVVLEVELTASGDESPPIVLTANELVDMVSVDTQSL